MGLNLFVSWKLHNSVIYGLQPKMVLFLEWPNQHKIMKKIGRKVAELILRNDILMQYNWKNFLIWYSARKSVANIYVWLKIKIFFERLIVWGEFTVVSIEPGWESNPDHFSGIYNQTTKISVNTVNTVSVNKNQITYINEHFS